MSQVRILLSQDEAGALADLLGAVRTAESLPFQAPDADLLKAVQHQCWAAVARAMLGGIKVPTGLPPVRGKGKSSA